MKKHRSTKYWIIGAFLALSGANLEKADAQVNESRVQRQATGVYRGRITNIKRTRIDPNHGNQRTLYDSANGKMRVPVTERNVKSRLNDNELDGNGRARLKGDGRRATVNRTGRKINYLVSRGSVDTLQDGHNPIKKGTAKGAMVLRGSKWIAKFGMNGKRIDNDSYTSLFSAKTAGKH